MTKENAKGATLDAAAKIAVLIDTLCQPQLVDAQANDDRCKVELMADAVGFLSRAKRALNDAYRS